MSVKETNTLKLVNKDVPEVLNRLQTNNNGNGNCKRLIKKELIGVFRKFGYLCEDKNYEVTIKSTSGNIAWINIHCIETIK